MSMKTMGAGTFKGRCLKIMDEVRLTRQPVVITKRGRPVAKLVPPDEVARDVFGCLSGVVEILGDIEEPVTPAADWRVW
jgi:prevent-host-death family protein